MTPIAVRVRFLLHVLIVASLLLSATSALAHDSRPAYLELVETDGGTFELIWKLPLIGGRVPTIELSLPPDCRDVVPRVSSNLGNSILERRLIDCGEAGLIGKQIRFSGLEQTSDGVLVRIVSSDGSTVTTLVKASQPWVEISGPRTRWLVALDYTTLGVEHILGGIDHLLFVLALLLIVRGRRRLLITITSFTLAHSITLAAATLGLVWVPAPPVEAVIALSIVFLASELVKVNRGERSLTARAPWLVAFSFGLLHGFGFAGALTDIGLPEREIPLALVTFNVGVEFGQLVFVAVALAVIALMRRVCDSWPKWTPQLAAYGIGCVAAFWFIERVISSWSDSY